jgi:hypothetical protein
MSIELKAKLFISADLVLICWSLNQQICTDLIASQTNILYSHNCVIMYLLNSLAVDNSYILYQHYLNENIPAKGIIVLTLISLSLTWYQSRFRSITVFSFCSQFSVFLSFLVLSVPQSLAKSRSNFSSFLFVFFPCCDFFFQHHV